MSNRKSSYRFLISAIALFFISIAASSASAQNVNVAGGLVGNGTYPTLEAAFTAINGGAQTGSAITIAIVGDTTEAAPAVLNANDWASVTISPSGGAARTVTGAIVGHLVDLNGADNVTFDGLNTGGNALTISNTGLGASTAIRFANDASTNVVRNASILGSGTASFGVVYFGLGTVTGNDGNNINNCNISASAGGNPLNGIYSLGTSAAIDNSGNTINANNISDYFNAGSATNGIQLASTGNSAWTISNNRLFQTANRIYTASGTHNGINIQIGSGYTISGNTIGFANTGGTGTTNMIGLTSGALGGTFPSAYTVGGTANATRYVAINAAFTAAGAVSEIQGNTVAGFALYTSSGAATTNGILCGIAVTSGNVNIGTTTGNTIGSTTGNGSLYTATTTTGGMVAGIYVTSSNAVAIRNNTIGAIDAMGTTASFSGGINGINIAGASSSYDVSGNTIGNSTNPNLRMGNLTTGANLSNVGTTFGVATGTGQLNGILSSQTGAGTIGTLALPNTIRNASLNSSSTSASIRGITATGIPTISYNNINNLTSQSANAGVSSTLLGGMGIFLNSISGVGAVVNNNTINSLSLTNTTTTGTNITGIAIYAGSTNLFANRIYDISNASTSVTAATPGTATGFFMRQPAGIINIYNNMVSLGNAQTANTSFNGIWQQNSAVAYTLNAYFNSINIEGVAAAGAQPSFGLNRGSYTATQVVVPVNALNNIFNNTRTGGTGRHYAIANNYLAAATATGWGANATNFNVLNAAAANVGYWGVDLTFGGWQAASASDTTSQSGVAVAFVNTATGDLHLNFGLTPTSLESGGTPIVGLTTDFDNQTRPGPAGSVNGGAFAPDLGADEFDGVFLDIAAPAITYTPLINTSSITDRVLSVTLTDVTGVATGGLAPRVYYRKNAGAYFSSNCLLSSGTVQNGTWGCTIVNANVGGVVTTDQISYFVVAQDTLGNLASNPSTGFTGTDVNTVTTPPTTPNQYTIVGSIGGTIAVGTGESYTSLTNAGGIFEAINANEVTGNITLDLTSDLTLETGTVALNEFASPFTILIKPSGAPRTITGTNTGALIRLNGADRVRIDGSTAATFADNVVGGNPALRELTIQNTNVGTAAVVISVGTTTLLNGAQNNRIQNVNVLGQDPLTTLVGISLGGSAPGTVGTDNDGNRVINCSVRRAIFGIYSAGASAANQNTGTIIQENDLTGLTTERIKRVGILVFNEDGTQITQNSVGGIDNTGESFDAIGIGVGAQTIGATAPGSGGVTNATVNRNRVNGVSQDATFSAAGIAVAGGTTGANIISNNMITGVISDGNAGDIVAGIYVAGNTGSITRLFYNSVSMTGDRSALLTPGTAQGPSYALAIAGADPVVELKNNIFYTSQVAEAVANPDALSFGVGMTATTFANLNSDYNVYFSTGVRDGGFRTTSLANTGGVNLIDLPAWRTATGGTATDDFNSDEGDPNFLNPLNDLHIQIMSILAQDKGTPVSILDDFDGSIRTVVGFAGGIADIGAHERIGPTAADASIGGRVTTANGQGIRNAVIVVTGNALPQPITVRTGSFGYYKVEGLEVGETYVVTVVSKRFMFSSPSRVISLTDSITDADFIADPQ